MKTDMSLAAGTAAAVEIGVALEQPLLAAAQKDAMAAVRAGATNLPPNHRLAVEGAIASVKASRPIPFSAGAPCALELLRRVDPLGDLAARGRLQAALAPLVPFMVRTDEWSPTWATKLPGSELEGIDIPDGTVAEAMRRRAAQLSCPNQRRALNGLAEIVTTTRSLPMWNHRISMSVLLRRLGLSGACTASATLQACINQWSRFFALDAHATTLRSGVEAVIEPAPLKLRRWLATRVGVGLHASVLDQSKASLSQIQRETGIAYPSLRQHRALVDEAAADPFIGLIARAPKMPVLERVALQELRRRRWSYIDRCVAQGVCLPVRATNRFAYDLALVAIQSGIEGDDLANDLTYVDGVYERAPLRQVANGAGDPRTTYGPFAAKLEEVRREEVREKKSRASLLSQTLGALREWRRYKDREAPGAPIGADLASANLEADVAAIQAAGLVKGPALFRAEMRRIQSVHAALLEDDGLGSTALDVAAAAILRCGKKLPELAAGTGLGIGQLTRVVRRQGLSEAVIDKLGALERATGLEPGRITDLVGPRTRRTQGGCRRRVPNGMSPYVADGWRDMDAAAFEEMVQWIDDNILHQPTAHGEAMRRAAALAKIAVRARKAAEAAAGTDPDAAGGGGGGGTATTPFERTLMALVAHKSGAFTTDGLKRRPGSFWGDHTARMRVGMLLELARKVTTPVEAGGFGADPQEFDLAHLVNPEIAKAFVDQVANSLADVEWEGKRRGAVITKLHSDLFLLLAQVFNERFGFAWQQAEFRERLARPDERLLPAVTFLVPEPDPEAHGRLRKLIRGYEAPTPRRMQITPGNLVGMSPVEWRSACADAADVYRGLAADTQLLAVRTRDPITTIKGLVHDPNPVALYLEHLAMAGERRPNILIDEVGHHLHTRDMVCGFLGPLLAMRPRNFREMLTSGTAKLERQIWFENGDWRIEIPGRLFKNWKSTPLFADGAPYSRTLPHAPGLHELLDYYFSRTRPFLLGIQDTPEFIVGRRGEPLSGIGYWRVTRDFTARHIAHNPWRRTGIPDVMPFNPYAYRYIRATDILLHPTSANPYLEAANTLQTGPGMIERFYARVRPDARTQKQDDRFCQLAGRFFLGS